MKTDKYFDHITLGTCYYPEQWPRELWAKDLERIKANGIEVIRIAEFAWTIFEPEEGIYSFGFFDEFMELAQAEEMKVIFCTPTATPPAWLTDKYPEVLNCDIEGNPYHHGARRHYNYSSPVYRRLCSNIAEQLAVHYGQHPSIIGWQIDNELNCELNEFYGPAVDKDFNQWIREKYKTLDALNQAWGTVFWNQTYTAWEQIHVPGKVVHNSNNPHQMLDYIRFVSDRARSFAHMQSRVLRQHIKPADFITTNGFFDYMDNHALTRESLNFYTYDSYPDFAFALCEDPLRSDDLNDRKWSKNLARMRSISPIFGIMEQQSGANGWNTRMEAPAPKPGQMTLWAMESIAHGADFVSFFRWRTSIMGTEIYWHGILDYSGRDNRRLRELGQIWDKTKRLSKVAGAVYKGSFAVLCDYNNEFDANVDVWHKAVEKASSKGIFNAGQLLHAPMDYVYESEVLTQQELSRYPVIFYPHGTILTETLCKKLEAYVKAGGTLILGCRTGYKDETGKCVMAKLPGLLRDLSGADVVDYTFKGPGDEAEYADWDGDLVEVPVFNDILEPLEGARVLARYTNDYYTGEAALIENTVGKGRVYYFGGAFSTDTAKVFLEKLGIAEPYKEVLSLPECCELAVRENDRERYYFVLNYQDRPVQIRINKTLTDLFNDSEALGETKLEAYGVRVYKEER